LFWHWFCFFLLFHSWSFSPFHASIGTAGVPGAGLIMLAMVLQSVGLPLEGLALVAGIDRVLDMFRTTLNITGDAAVAVAIDATEKSVPTQLEITE